MLRSWWFFVCVFVWSASPAGAQDAREFFAAGEEDYRLGRYDDAIADWARAYELDPRPLIQYNLAQAFERAGRIAEAVTAYESFLAATTPQDAKRLEAQARLAALRERIARTAIVVRTTVVGAIVLVDGEERARTPRTDPIAVAPGRHRIVVRLDGQDDYTTDVTVAAGTSIDVEPSFGDASVASTEAGDGASDRSVAPFIVLASGGALLVAGGITGGLTLARANAAEYRDDADADAAHTLGITTDVLLSVGAGAAIGGLVWGIVSRRSGDSAPPVVFVPSIGRESASLLATGRF